MTIPPSNPRVAAIQQDVQQSYDALNQLIDGPLSQLPSEKLYQSPAGNEWTIMENLAHIVEFMPYWGNQIAKLVAQPGQNFGRVQQDERRLKEIRDHAHDSLAQIKALLPPAYARLQETEFELAESHGYEASTHRRFVGAGYFDDVSETISDGASAGARGTRGTKRALQFGTKCVRATCDTRNVITDMGHDPRTGLERKQSIERRHAMNFSGGNVQPQRDIVESAGANPADAVLDRMEHG